MSRSNQFGPRFIVPMVLLSLCVPCFADNRYLQVNGMFDQSVFADRDRCLVGTPMACSRCSQSELPDERVYIVQGPAVGRSLSIDSRSRPAFSWYLDMQGSVTPVGLPNGEWAYHVFNHSPTLVCSPAQEEEE